MVKTRAEIEYLKQNWTNDPCWDIETEKGFEDYKDELWEFRLEKEEEWNKKYCDELWLKSCKMGIRGNLILAEYLLRLESKIEAMIEREDARQGH